MKYLKWLGIVLFCGYIHSLYTIQTTKQGCIPTYIPYQLNVMKLFLPYNTKAIIVGDEIANIALDIARSLECSTVFCFSAGQQDFKTLSKYGETFLNIHPYFGLFYEQEGLYPYFSTEPYEKSCESFYKFAGSLLEPIDKTCPFLFGETHVVPTFRLPTFCEGENLSKVHLIYLNCGGNELQILQSHPQLVNNAIVIYIKTYHRQIRKNISKFRDLDSFMTSCDLELMSHYIYDNVIGDALYVKKKYIDAVFRSKEL